MNRHLGSCNCRRWKKIIENCSKIAMRFKMHIFILADLRYTFGLFESIICRCHFGSLWEVNLLSILTLNKIYTVFSPFTIFKFTHRWPGRFNHRNTRFFFWAFAAPVDVQRLNNRAKRILMSRPWLDINRIRDESLEYVRECSTYNTAMWSTVARAPLGYHSLRDRFVRRHTNKFRCCIAIPQNFHSANSATCYRCVLLFRQLLFGDCILSNELNENDSTIYSLRMRAHRMSCSSLHRCFANPSRKFSRPFRCSKNIWKWPRAWNVDGF